jgi:hypothetical protein
MPNRLTIQTLRTVAPKWIGWIFIINLLQKIQLLKVRNLAPYVLLSVRINKALILLNA